MKPCTMFALLLLGAVYYPVQAQHFQVPDAGGMHWFKGDPSAHSKNDLGDSTLEEIVGWYKAHGYDFLSVTDHAAITYSQSLASSADPAFLLIPGLANTTYGNLIDVDVIGLNVAKAILPHIKPTVLAALQEGIDAIREQGGTPIIFHPNFKWTLDKETLLKVQNCNLFELYSAFPRLNSQGDKDHPSMEQVWDYLLSAGRRFYGVTADDTYYFKFSSEQYFSNPGSAWVMVRAKTLDPVEITRGLESGLFYSTTGVMLQELDIKPTRIEIAIQQATDSTYVTDFIGSSGKLLLRTKDNPAIYLLGGESNYVRAKVTDSKGKSAWVQPIFIDK